MALTKKLWKGDGMTKNENGRDRAVDALGLNERELAHLTEYNLDEAALWAELAARKGNPDHAILAEFFKRRAKAFNHLAAVAAADADAADMEAADGA